ncbi:hypothetical protein AD943_01440 [Gluconobacter roseus]|nr:hypothetical protein AD943_01440 [Gluconobacter roseus]
MMDGKEGHDVFPERRLWRVAIRTLSASFPAAFSRNIHDHFRPFVLQEDDPVSVKKLEMSDSQETL